MRNTPAVRSDTAPELRTETDDDGRLIEDDGQLFTPQNLLELVEIEGPANVEAEFALLGYDSPLMDDCLRFLEVRRAELLRIANERVM